MAWSAISPFRPNTLCVVWPRLGPYVFLPHMATLYPLSEAMGTTAVSRPPLSSLRPEINSHQYHKSSLHGSHLLRRLLPVILFLHACSLL